MKKLVTSILCTVMCVGIFAISTNAESKKTVSLYPENEIPISRNTQAMDDGTYIEITISKALELSRASNSVSGTKTFSCRNKDGVILWQFFVHGTFSVNNGTAACTSVSHSYKIVDSDWNYVSGTSSKSGNKATGHGKFNRKMLFITVETKECDVILSCDGNGKLS